MPTVGFRGELRKKTRLVREYGREQPNYFWIALKLWRLRHRYNNATVRSERSRDTVGWSCFSKSFLSDASGRVVAEESARDGRCLGWGREKETETEN